MSVELSVDHVNEFTKVVLIVVLIERWHRQNSSLCREITAWDFQRHRVRLHSHAETQLYLVYSYSAGTMLE